MKMTDKLGRENYISHSTQYTIRSQSISDSQALLYISTYQNHLKGLLNTDWQALSPEFLIQGVWSGVSEIPFLKSSQGMLSCLFSFEDPGMESRAYVEDWDYEIGVQMQEEGWMRSLYFAGSMQPLWLSEQKTS